MERLTENLKEIKTERIDSPRREFPKPNVAGFFKSEDIHEYLKDIETEIKGYIKEIKAGKTLKGFDLDSETYFQCYRMHDRYYFGTFTEGVNSDYEMQELDCTDKTLCKYILENCGLYPEFRIED